MYAIFAANEQDGIKLDLNYLTVNGNACTNGVYSTYHKGTECKTFIILVNFVDLKIYISRKE